MKCFRCISYSIGFNAFGIIARGTAFTFRNYDAIDDNWKNVYREIFYYSSLVTPFFIGCIAAATISGSINPDAKDFLSLYVYSWFNPFGIAVGVFTIVICGYLASIYSLREADSKADVKQMMKKTRDMMLAVFVSGGLVFVVAYFSEIPLIDWVFTGTDWHYSSYIGYCFFGCFVMVH
jgi:cytochrome d ubiquinol oxidase subunit II